MLQDIKVRVKKIEMIMVNVKPKFMINRSQLNLTQSAILERASAFQLGVTLHERRSAFSRCYCANLYVNNFCRSFVVLWFFSVYR